MVKAKGPQHARYCQRWGGGSADSPKVMVCKYCGFRGSAEMVAGIGDQHLAACPRSNIFQAKLAAARTTKAAAVDPGSSSGWSLLACFCCGADARSQEIEIQVIPEVEADQSDKTIPGEEVMNLQDVGDQEIPEEEVKKLQVDALES